MVRAYLAALGAGDDTTARALLADHALAEDRDPCLVSIADVELTSFDVEDGASESLDAYREVAVGWAGFNATYARGRTPWGCGDGRFAGYRNDAGHTVVEFRLVRNSASSPWRVQDFGDP